MLIQHTHTHGQMHSFVHLLIEMSPEREKETAVAGTASLDACHNFSLTLILSLAVRLISIILNVGLFSLSLIDLYADLFTLWSLSLPLLLCASLCISRSLSLSPTCHLSFFRPSLYFATFDL